MRRTILMLGLAWSLSFPAAAHQCVLEGSTSEAIRLIKQGAVRFAGERLEDPKTVLTTGANGVLQVGKRRIAKVRID